MKRFTTSFVVLVFVAVLCWPVGATAQDQYGPGTPVDAATSESVTAFIDEFVALFNNRDPAVIELVNHNYAWFFSDSYDGSVSFLMGGAVPIEMFAIRDVQSHANEILSAEVTYSGWGREGRYYTERWYFQKNPAGTYAIIDALPAEIHVPDPMTAGDIDVSLSLDGLAISQAEIAAVDVLRLHLTNTEAVPLSVSLYELPPGSTPIDIQTSLVAEDFSQLIFLGDMPIFPQQTMDYGFLIDPDKTYVLQLYAYDTAVTYAYVLEGEQFLATFTVTPRAEATPST